MSPPLPQNSKAKPPALRANRISASRDESTLSSPVKRSKIAGYFDLRSSRTAGQLSTSVLRDSHQLVPSVVKPAIDEISCLNIPEREWKQTFDLTMGLALSASLKRGLLELTCCCS